MSVRKFVLLALLIIYLVASIYALALTWIEPIEPQPKVDENGREVVDDDGNPIMEEVAPPEFNDIFTYVVTGISGVMVAAFSKALGISVPTDLDEVRGVGMESLSAARKFWEWLKSVWNKITPSDFSKHYFVWGQTIIGTISIITWFIKPAVTPDPIKNIAALSFAMFLSVANDVIGDTDE
jgi:hypothetical protein